MDKVKYTRKFNQWPYSQELFLKLNWPNIDACMQFTGRNRKAVYMKANRMGLCGTYDHRFYTFSVINNIGKN